ncbi:MAG: hypothetical protein PUB99_01500 [Oscillospiraceae bacterium]|nr:hypothetical protein [Oscillospiraceae bacterium]
MYCPNCSKEIGENKSCPVCGYEITAPTPSDIPSGAPQAMPTPAKKPNRKTIIIVIAVAAVLLAIIIGVSSKGKSNDNPDVDSDEIVTSVDEEKNTIVDVKKAEENIEEAKKLAAQENYAEAIKLLKSIKNNDEATTLLDEYREIYLNPENFGVYWDDDEMSDYHWAYANGQGCNYDEFSFCFYIHQNKSTPSDYGFHFWSSFYGYSGSKEWIFPYTVRIKGDVGDPIDIAIKSHKSDMNGKVMYEWFNFDLTKEEFYSICELIMNSSEVTLRFSGNTYHDDHNLTQKQMDDIKVIYEYAKAFDVAY